MTSTVHALSATEVIVMGLLFGLFFALLLGALYCVALLAYWIVTEGEDDGVVSEVRTRDPVRVDAARCDDPDRPGTAA